MTKKNAADTSVSTRTNSNSNSNTKNTKAADHVPMEFGGPLGAAIGFIALPSVVYYFWLCLEFHRGALIYPTSFSDIGSFFYSEIYTPFMTHALPTYESTAIYLTWVTWQAVLAVICPGPWGYGAVLSNGSRLQYKLNGAFVWACTLVAVIALHVSGVFPLYRLYDNYASLLTTASIFATLLAAACHIGALIYKVEERMSGNLVYDYFMGAVLNPRVGSFDIKFWAEIRPGIMLWFFLTCSMAAKQYEQYGVVTLPMLFMCFYHLCYANACYKGEECIPMSMDIIYEKFGWMLCWANLVWVPFTYCFPAYYLLKIEPFEHEWYFGAFVLLLHVSGYYIFDTANSQKDYFRADFPGKQLDNAPKRDGEHRRGFPRLPWGRLPKEGPNKAKFIQTKRGTKLLISGWWGIARHMNYTADLMMAWSWGFTTGFGSFIPYFYGTYMTLLLIHRERRDYYDCKNKYGSDWDIYVKEVPYGFIPYIY